MKTMITGADIKNAHHKIRGDIYQTPLEFSPKLSEISAANVYLKMEHLQLTGSFKIRGVLNKIKSLDKKDFNKTFVAASTGNHAAAFAHASSIYNFKAVLFLPEKTNEAKIAALETYNVKKIFFGKNSMETEAKARDYANEIGGILIHPYNDPEIIKGQGSIGLEIQEELPNVDTILAPIGGGGLIAGICSYFSDDKKVKIIGCQPINASEMHDSIQAGSIQTPSKLSTIADATAGGIEKESLTFDICKKELSSIELIAEDDIKRAIAFCIKHHQTIIEPGAALPISALLNSKKFKEQNVVLILTGKKINTDLLTEIMKDYGNNY